MKKYTPFSNTERKETSTNTLAAGTMASLTKSKEPTKSYGNRFSEQTRIRNDPGYVAPISVNISSEADFPSLGGAKPPTHVVPTPARSFIKMAEDWGKKIEMDEEANRMRIINEEKDRRRRMKELMKHPDHTIKSFNKNSIIPVSRFKHQYYDHEEKKYKNISDDSVEDSFESGPSHDEEEDENDDIHEEDEINANIVNDRRHRDELY